ncbi:radical SAM protein [Desulfothermus naphthae]
MKRILLVQPWNYHDKEISYNDLSTQWRNAPYGLVSLTTFLKKHNVPVKLLDLQPIMVRNKGSLSICLKHIKKELTEFNPDIIGISFFSYQAVEAKTIVDYIRKISRKLNKKPILVAGGIHASVEPELTIEQLDFDYVFIGEGELGLLKMAQNENLSSIGGLFGKNLSSKSSADIIKDLNGLPFVDWSLCDYKFYSFPSKGKLSWKAERTLDIMLGRGCPYKCSFCAYSRLSKVRYFSSEYIIEQIENMKKKFPTDSIYFIDSSIGNNKKLLLEFCEMALKKNIFKDIKWYANIRADQVDEDILIFMWEAGCRALFYGFESGSERVLSMMNKKCTVEDNYKAALLHNKLKFPYHASMILGYPGETEEDIKKSIKFILDIRPPMVHFNWYVPLPGSKDYEKLKKLKLLDLNNILIWRQIGESKPNDVVYADIEKKRFLQLFLEASRIAQQISREVNFKEWIGIKKK